MSEGIEQQERLLTTTDLANELGCSREHVWALRKAGHFPQPCAWTGPKGTRPRWRRDQVQGLVLARQKRADEVTEEDYARASATVEFLAHEIACGRYSIEQAVDSVVRFTGGQLARLMVTLPLATRTAVEECIAATEPNEVDEELLLSRLRNADLPRRVYRQLETIFSRHARYVKRLNEVAARARQLKDENDD